MVTLILNLYRTAHEIKCLVDSDEYCYDCDASTVEFFWGAWLADLAGVVLGILAILGELS